MKKESVALIYSREREKHEEAFAVLKKKQNLLGWLRLVVIVLTGVLAFQLFSHVVLGGWIVVITGIGIFLFIVSKDADNNRQINHLKLLSAINEEEVRVLNGDYWHRYDGSAFAPAEHAYVNDLDMFGKASLYQYVNRCNSEQGKTLLAQNFLHPLPVDQVRERQTAIKEIAPQYQWRQQFEAISLKSPVTAATQTKINQWLSREDNQFDHSSWKFILPIYALISVGSAIAAVAGLIPGSVFSFVFLVYFIFSGMLSRKAMNAYHDLNGVVLETDVLYQLIECTETKKFEAPLLQQLQSSVTVANELAHIQIKKLKSILDRFDLRLNILVFIFINSFLLWDVWQMRALNNWRKNNRHKLGQWYRLIAEMEVLNSLSTLYFNRPSWVFPQLTDQHFTLKGEQVGHPLINQKNRVDNNFRTEGPSQIALITGSNMAGKSTFLRSLGVNIVLAQTGAPVCAQSFILSPVQLVSSMRIADNLAENTSTFYAELKKLKMIIEAANRHEPVFILLDEILRGTNSLDRHTGSKALMRQLIKANAVAVIATHDVELAKLEEEYPASVHNYHFDVQVEGEELYFDYKLKTGVCTSLNASILMKKIGIEL